MRPTRYNPRKSGQIAGLLLIRMSIYQTNNTCKNCGFLRNFDKILIVYKSIKMAIFTKNIPKHTDQSVCHKKHTIKTAENWHCSPCVCYKFSIFIAEHRQKNKNLHIRATQSILHNMHKDKKHAS
jgi:hypothetical protein